MYSTNSFNFLFNAFHHLQYYWLSLNTKHRYYNLFRTIRNASSHWKRLLSQKPSFIYGIQFNYENIKLTSARNGLLLFAKEEYKIYRSGNVGGLKAELEKWSCPFLSCSQKPSVGKNEKKKREGKFSKSM